MHPVWRSGNGVRHIRRARLVLGLVTIYAGSTISYLSRPLSLAIPPWVGAMSTGDGFGNLWEETALLKLRPSGALKISL